MSKKPKPRKKPVPRLTCCTQCGRDTANKCRICAVCLRGPKTAAAAKEPETPEDYYLGGEEWNGPLEDG